NIHHRHAIRPRWSRVVELAYASERCLAARWSSLSNTQTRGVDVMKRSMSRLHASLVLAPLLLTGFVTTDATAQVRVLQTNSTDTMVHLIDPVTHKIVGEIAGIPVAHGIAAAPDGSRIYVSGEAETALKVVDAHTLEIIKTIPLSAR